MKANTSLIAQIQGTLGSSPGFGQVEIPEMVMPVQEFPLPFGQVITYATLGGPIDFANNPTSGAISHTINIGASVGAQDYTLMLFDRGIFRLFGMMHTRVVGAGSSANPYSTHVRLGVDNDIIWLMMNGWSTGGGAVSYHHSPWTELGTFHFARATAYAFFRHEATGASESIGTHVSLYAQRLL